MHKDFPSLHRAFLHPALPASEHKIPGVEKPVTSASVPIMGERGPFGFDWVWSPARPPSSSNVYGVSSRLGSPIALEGNQTTKPSPAILPTPLSQHLSRLTDQGAILESASVLGLVPFH